MAIVTSCKHCGGSDIYHQRVVARNRDMDMDLLPGVGDWGGFGKFDLYACADCGYTQFFVQSDRLDQVRENWEKVEAPTETRIRRRRTDEGI